MGCAQSLLRFQRQQQGSHTKASGNTTTLHRESVSIAGSMIMVRMIPETCWKQWLPRAVVSNRDKAQQESCFFTGWEGAIGFKPFPPDKMRQYHSFKSFLLLPFKLPFVWRDVCAPCEPAAAVFSKMFWKWPQRGVTGGYSIIESLRSIENAFIKAPGIQTELIRFHRSF